MLDRLRAADRALVARTVVSAAALAFLLESLIDLLAGNASVALFVGRLVVYPVAVAFFWLVGWWLGTRTWPRRGIRLARAMLRRHLREKHALIFLSDRPDRRLLVPRRIWEVVAFSAGATLLVASTLILLGAPTALVVTLAGLLPAIALWSGFVLVPYWLFSSLGLRSADPVRWLILPLSRRYADRLKLSNGALALLGLVAAFNATLRAGGSGADAVAASLVTALRIVASVLIVAAAAVAHYVRDERALRERVEAEALEMGIRDGRGMTDGDFLPRLPAARR